MQIEIIKGNTYTRQITTTLNDSPLTLTGKTVRFMVKEMLDDLDNNALINKTITTFTGTSSNEFTLDIASSETNLTPKKYYFEFRLDTTPNRKQTLIVGDFIIKNNLIKS